MAAFNWAEYQQASDAANPQPSITAPTTPTPNSGVSGMGTGGTTPGTPTQTPSGQSPQQYFQSLFPPGSQLSPQMLLDHEADLKAHGITLIKNAAGQPGKISLADGSAFDVIQGAGSGQNIAQWNAIAGPGGVPLGGGGGPGGMNFGGLVSPIGLFTPPTEQDALNSPGLQFALDEAHRMSLNGPAAHGTLLNGRVQQALQASDIGNALQGFNDVYNRAANTYGINYNTQTRNQDAPFSKYLDVSKLGQTAAAAS